MEPKKNLKKHKLVEPKWGWNISQEELISRINDISAQIHRNTMTGGANWVIMGAGTADLFNEAMEGYSNDRYEDLPNIEMGDFRVEDDTYVQDITITPNRSIERIDLDISVLPSGGVYYTGTTQEGNEPWRHL
jgi:hypothetical protein